MYLTTDRWLSGGKKKKTARTIKLWWYTDEQKQKHTYVWVFLPLQTYGVPWITCLESRGISPYCCRWCISRKILWRKYRAHFFGIFHVVKFLLTKECFWQTQLADYWIWSRVTEGRIWTKCIENVCAANNFVIFS